LAKGKEILAGQLKYMEQEVDTVSMVINNQKNGVCGDILLSHHAIA